MQITTGMTITTASTLACNIAIPGYNNGFQLVHLLKTLPIMIEIGFMVSRCVIGRVREDEKKVLTYVI